MDLEQELIAKLDALAALGRADPEATGSQATKLLVQWLRDTGLHDDIADAFEAVERY